jgi:hypothetical protein
MLNAPELRELRDANPTSLEDARRFADECDLHARLAALASAAYGEPRRRGRGRTLPIVAAAALVLAAVLFATPAWGLVRGILPFWSQPKAPAAVRVVFSSLNRVGAPRGMSPEAVSGDTRAVGQFTLGGSTRTLWVAPAKNGGFCALWIPRGGGGCVTAHQPISTGALLSRGVPAWITGDALAAAVSNVMIRFSDGRNVRPRIVWVSAPIDAGFFAYDVPTSEQTRQVHVTAVDAYDRAGRLVERQRLTG